MSPPPPARSRVVFSGHVQGVGFRDTTRRIATRCDVSGYVRNLSDGNVELVAEGSAGEIAGFLSEIERQMSGFIRNRTVEELAANGEFVGFEIRL